jgi:dolichyl-phosphate-mannose-protein mannosyltransferase
MIEKGLNYAILGGYDIVLHLATLAWLLFAYHCYHPGLNVRAFGEILSRLVRNLSSAGFLFSLPICLLLLVVYLSLRKRFSVGGVWRVCLSAEKVGAGRILGLMLTLFLLWLRPIDILLIIWIWLVAQFLGKASLSWIGIRMDPGLERLALSSAVGLSILSLVALLLAILHVLYSPVAYCLLITCSFFGAADLRKHGLDDWLSLVKCQRKASSRYCRYVHGFLVLYLVGNLALIWISALGPPIEFDDLTYHLTGPKSFVATHSLSKLVDIPHVFLPKNIEMLFTLGMLLHNEVAAKAFHCLLGFLTMLLLYAYSSRRWGESVGLVAFAVLASSPLFLWEMRTAHNDVGLAIYVFIALYSVIRWLQSRDRPWFFLGIISTGFSLGVKYHGLLGLLSLTMMIAVHKLIVDKCFHSAIKSAAKFGFLSALGLLPWSVVNFFQTGNPIFPLLNGLFPSPYWTPELTQMIIKQQQEGAVVIGLGNCWEAFTIFWRMLADQTNRFHGRIGPFFFLLIPLLILQVRKGISSEVKLTLGFSLIYSTCWVFTAQHSRYFLPVLPGLAIVAAYASVEWVQGMRTQRNQAFSTAVQIILIFMAVFSTPFFGRYGTHPHYGSSLLPSLPLKYLLGRETRDEHLSVHVPSYSAIKFFNSLPRKEEGVVLVDDGACQLLCGR